jgi:hypothetical protein
MKIKSPACPVCGKTSTLDLPNYIVAKIRRGTFIQESMKDYDADTRELVLTGAHPACWDSMMPEDDEEEFITDPWDERSWHLHKPPF